MNRDHLLTKLAGTPGMTLQRIGDQIGVSRQRAGQLLARLGLRLARVKRPRPTTPQSFVAEPMTPDQLREALEKAGLSQVEAARRLSCADRTVRRWCQAAGTKGHRRIDPVQQARINAMLAEAMGEGRQS